MINKIANGRVIKRVNEFKIAVLVLLVLATLNVYLQSDFRSNKDPDFWVVSIRMLPNLRIEVFSGELSGTGVLGTVDIKVSDDAFIARQLGAVYQDGKWEFVK